MRNFCGLVLMVGIGIPTICWSEASVAPQEQVQVTPLLEKETSLLEQPFSASVKGRRVRMRVKPNVDSQIVRELAEGELMVVVGECKDYYAVMAPSDIKAYIYRKYLTNDQVDGNRVNVRLAPSLESPVIVQLNAHDAVATVKIMEDGRWAQITLPSNVNFFVAKNYLEKRGPAHLIQLLEQRRAEAVHLLSAAYLVSQTELRKPFDQIDISQVAHSFERVIKEYTDLPDLCDKAKMTLSMAQDLYLQKRKAFQEALLQTNQEANVLPPGINKELEEYQRRVQAFQKEVEHPFASHEKTLAQQTSQNPSQKLAVELLESPSAGSEKMRAWESVEESRYHLWAAEHVGKSIDQFYSEQALNGHSLRGVLESYDRNEVVNRPGDFLLKVNNQIVAFLYSTKVNLDSLVGKEVILEAFERPNNYFAFPAYFVWSGTESLDN